MHCEGNLRRDGVIIFKDTVLQIPFPLYLKIALDLAILTFERACYIFDKKTGNFTQIADLAYSRQGHACGFINSNNAGPEVLVAGGNPNDISVEILSLSTMEWRVGPNLPKGIDYPASVPFGNSFLIIGGSDFEENTFYDTIYEYEVEGGNWIERPEKLGQPKYDLTAIMLDTKDVDCEK